MTLKPSQRFVASGQAVHATTETPMPVKLLTAANVVTMGSLGGATLIITNALNGSFAYLGPLFLLCVLCDGLDGYVARKTGQAGDLGMFLDSLVDVVSFGVAPLVAARNSRSGRGIFTLPAS